MPKVTQTQLAQRQLAAAITDLETMIAEKSSEWLIDGQMKAVRSLLAAAECISDKAVPQLIAKALDIEESAVKENLAAYRAAADFIFRKERVKANMDVQAQGYAGTGWLNQGERRPVVSKLTWD